MNKITLNQRLAELNESSKPIFYGLPDGEYIVELNQLYFDDENLHIHWTFVVLFEPYENTTITRIDDLNESDHKIEKVFDDFQTCKIEINKLDDINERFVKSQVENVNLRLTINGTQIQICERIP